MLLVQAQLELQDLRGLRDLAAILAQERLAQQGPKGLLVLRVPKVVQVQRGLQA